MKTASKRVGGNLFTHATSEAVSTKSIMNYEAAKLYENDDADGLRGVFFISRGFRGCFLLHAESAECAEDALLRARLPPDSQHSTLNTQPLYSTQISRISQMMHSFARIGLWGVFFISRGFHGSRGGFI